MPVYIYPQAYRKIESQTNYKTSTPRPLKNIRMTSRPHESILIRDCISGRIAAVAQSLYHTA